MTTGAPKVLGAPAVAHKAVKEAVYVTRVVADSEKDVGSSSEGKVARAFIDGEPLQHERAVA